MAYHPHSRRNPVPVWIAMHERRRERLRRQQNPPFGIAIVLIAVIGAIGLTVFPVLFALQQGATAFANVQDSLPPTQQLATHQSFKTVRIFDRNGTLLWEFYSPQGGRRTIVPLSEVSQNLIDATMAA